MRLLPAYPLFLKNPYFSIWSRSDVLTDSDTTCWQNDRKPLYGTIAVDGESYVFLGKKNGYKRPEQTKLSLTAFSTDYSFAGDGFTLDVSFVSPLPPNDIDLMSNPVCYLKYAFSSIKPVKRLCITLFAGESLCYNSERGNGFMRGDVFKLNGREVAYFGKDKQDIFSHSADLIGADWGYLYISGGKCNYFGESDFDAVAKGGEKSIYNADEIQYISASDLHSNCTAACGKLLIAFDELCSVYYYGAFLTGYYYRAGKSTVDAIEEIYRDFDTVERKCRDFDGDLKLKAREYGEDYLLLLYASLRQSVAAHTLVQDGKGRLLFLSKECGSDGCIATVDISYPSMPLYLLYNPKLVEGMLYPIFDFAGMPVWEYDFAPHDAGVYPFCCGQYYAIYNKTEGRYQKAVTYNVCDGGVLPRYYTYPAGSELYNMDKQMPIEECGNMLILSALAAKYTGSVELPAKYFNCLQLWADYICKKDVYPERQLCTDDFAGHLNNNINLAIKGVIGIGAFAQICERLGKRDLGVKYRAKAEERAAVLEAYAGEGVLPLSKSCDTPSFSLKYNFYPDLLLGTRLFSRELMSREFDEYMRNFGKYGYPLDSRALYTKSDWEIWTLSLTPDLGNRRKVIKALAAYLKESPDRVPFSDWYDSVSGESCRYGGGKMFVNRSVQGGCFALLLNG
ncbi:MAG: DUF4965 domain-containing protein [Clostridiales bacterium]|jgi:hypothetical protein|nr:DUF4965 domain-containing protein [Clostridiales bacterium]